MIGCQVGSKLLWKSMYVHNRPFVEGQPYLHVKNQQLARLAMVMRGVSWRGESQEVVKPMAIARLKIKDIYILCNMIETFWRRKVIKAERWKPYVPFKFEMAWAQTCKNISTCLCKHSNISIAKGRN
jgi:hypothetical protein